MYLNSVPTPSEGYLVIEPDSAANREIIYYTSKGANYVTCPSVAAGRGVGGTSAAAHSSGVAVQMNVVAEHFEALQDGTAFAVGGIGASPYADGWTPVLGSTPNTITANGNRNYDLVFNGVDLSSTLSPGMKLKLTRTVAAPTKCADLESTSSQYFSKTSPAGMTFTDDFVVSAWVKLESYTSGSCIASRSNGSSGWIFNVSSSGQVGLYGYNGGASNVSQVLSYASLPLNKWVHVAAQLDMSTFTATTTTSYVMFDGVDVAAAVSRGGTNPTALVQAGNLEIGSANGGSNYFDGKIAQVAIYSAKVTQATIKASMSQTLTGSETSLISAYTFNNSINDLNANANNLTANGGAAATDTDSPFANSSSTVTAGTLEYAEINSVTFSTNTTVNVRVPDTCQIPTSGGVSAVSYSTQSNPYGLPAFSNILGYTIVNSTNTLTTPTTTTQLPGLITSVVVPTGRKVKVVGYTNVLSNSGANANNLAICLGSASDANRLEQFNQNTSTGGTLGSAAYLDIINIPTTSSVTYALGASAAGGNVSQNATVITPSFIRVELV